MKFLNKIDRYLLENHPLIWMTKSHYVLLASVVVNVFFWLWGYFHVDLEMLQHHIGDDEFFESYAIYIYLLIAVMFLIVWAVSYFKKSAVRHLYPLGKFYFTKLLVLLFVNFFLIVAPFLSFNVGMNAKTNQLVDYNELKDKAAMVNLAQAFLPNSSQSYKNKDLFELENPHYEIINYDTWNSEGYEACGYNPYDHPENCDTTVDGIVVQCVKTVRKKNNCYESSRCFVGAMKVPAEYLSQSTNVNYLVYEFVDTKEFGQAPSKMVFDYYYYDNYSRESLDFNKQIRAISGNGKKIKQELEDFDVFLTKYEVPHAFNTDVISRYFEKHKGELNANAIFVDNNYNDYSFEYNYDKEGYFRNLKAVLKKYEERSRNTTLADLENSNGNSSYFMIDNSRLKCLFENSRRSYYWNFCYVEVMVLCFIALGLAFLFLLLSFADFITLVITVPVTGVLIIINVLICVSIYSVAREDDYLFFVPFSFAIIISVAYILYLMKKNPSRRITHALSYLTGFVSTLFFVGLAVAFDLIFKTRVFECDYYRTKHTFVMEWMEDPGFSLILSSIGIVLYTFTIRKLIAKPD